MADQSLPHKHTGDEPKNSELQESNDMLKRLENQEGGRAKITHEEETDTKKHIDSEERYAEQIHTGHVSSVLFICVTFILAVSGLMFASPIILLINNKEQLVNDLNDGFYAYYTYSNKILGGQIGGNCNEETIQCKFKTMSPMLKERFERYGFTVAANEAANKRYNVSLLKIPDGGVVSSAATLSSARKNDPRANALIDKVYNARTGIYQDRQFYERLLSRFGIEQSNPLGGSNAKEFNESFDKRVEQGDARYADDTDDPAQAAENSRKSQDSIDENGRGIYSLKSLSKTSDQWRGEIYTNLINKANTHLSLACAFATYGNLAENAVARAKTITIARFAMNYLAVADDLKSFSTQSNSQIAVDVMANKLIQPGSDGKNAMDVDSYRAPALGEGLKDRMSIITQLSPVAQLSILRAFGIGPSMPGSEYLKQALARGVVQNSAREKTPAGLCAEGMSGSQNSLEHGRLCWSPAAMPLASYIGAIAGGIIGAARDPIEKFICPASVKAVVEMVKQATRPEASSTLPTLIQAASTSAANQFTSTESGTKAQNIIFAGAGILLGDRAQSLGMRPASTISFAEYMMSAQTAKQQVESQERTLARSTPWDATNPYSFLGSVVAKLSPVGSALPGQSWQASTVTLLSSLTTSLATVAQSGANALYTQPVHLQLDRLSPTNTAACGIPVSLTTEITPDFACNVRYSMSREEREMSISDILDYMTEAHPDNAKSLSEIQGRDMSADSSRGSQMLQQAQDGANAPYIDKKTGKPNKYTEYAKFLEYCVNRHDPWGGVGMAVEEQDEVYTEDEEIDGRRTSNGKSLLREKQQDAPKPSSYYGLGWGGKSDQDWYTGKKCADDSGEMMKYFRAYTMACGVLASMSGSRQCWHEDTIPNSYDDFYVTNNIIFKASS